MTRRFLRDFVAILVICWNSTAILGATINVPADQGTIQAGIDAAVSGVDEVVVADGTYNEIIDFGGKAITVRSVNGAAVTIIDATLAADPGDGKPVVRCDNGETATTVLKGFTLTGGTGDTSALGGGTPAGGGMYNGGTSPTVTTCTFTGNITVAVWGSGMFNNSSSPTVTNCAFIGNTGARGTGMYNRSSSSPTVTNCTFSGNTASLGGGMTNDNSSPTVTNCTFSGNTASLGGGMFNIVSSSPTMTNCILWGNSDLGGMDESAQIHDEDSFGVNTTVVNYTDLQGGWTGAGGTGNLNADPLFVDADGADNTVGTVDDDLRLSAGSPCIDAGDNSVVTESTDLDGNGRIITCTVDMGAYEDQTPGIHNITQSTFFTTIQAAINAAVANDVIEVAPCTYNEIINFNGKAITLQSTDPTNPAVVAATIIDGGAAGSVVTCSSGETSTTVLDGFTITNGSAISGGGMANDSASPTVVNCVFSGNTSTGTFPVTVGGGGMYNKANSHPTVTNCIFSGNTAILGGGMCNTSSSPTVSNCTFSGNSGGGMRNLTSGPTVTNCSFSGNTSLLGGGMQNQTSSPTLTNCTFSRNTATSQGGGGMSNGSSNPMVINCIFNGNSALTVNGDGGGMYNIFSSSPTVTNCIFSGNSAVSEGGGMSNLNTANPTVTNCTFWGNSDLGGMDESAQIHVADTLTPSVPVVNFSNVQGAWTGVGLNNICADPLFVDADGADNMVGTDDDDLRLSAGSPCIDAGDNAAVPLGVITDLDGNPRFIDDSRRDTGNGTPPLVDMGAYEFQGSPGPGFVPADFDKDGDVDGLDFTAFASCFNKSGNPPRTLGCPQN